ncbi:MAG: pitrilysin family protein, partial [Bryobacteraceae bacterium]
MNRFLPLLLIAAAALAEVRLPPYTRQVLSNGIVIDIMPRREVPLVTVRIAIKGGLESDPPDQAGLSGITAEMLRRGTTERTADQFSQELDSLGATYQADTDLQSTNIEAEFLAKDLDTGLDIVFDSLLRPIFPEIELKKVLAQRIDGAKALKDNPGAAVGAYYNSFAFGSKHPYGRPADELSLARIQRQHVLDYHKRMYAARNMIVVLAGDVDAPAVSKKLASLLGAVPPGAQYAWKKPEQTAASGIRVAIVDKPDATQTRFLVGMPGITRTHPDRVPLWIVNTLFGGRFTSILNDELRVNTGLTYGAQSRLDTNRMPGLISISTFTRTETTGKALDLAVDLLKRFRNKGITAEQLASSKAYLKGTYPSEHLETPEQLASVLTEIELYDLNRNEVDDLYSRIDSVTLEQANTAIRKHYSPENLTFLLLGNATQFREHLQKYSDNVLVVPITKP